jgi:2-polyprenyl-3-methyl-5-hydroxy-6-metoxy-1,4-benzoquinol methylase
MQRLLEQHPHPLRLAALRWSAWQTTTFYPDHDPRLWEYPEVAQQVIDAVAPGARVADIGAGISPLAPYLQRSGYEVHTVDPSQRRCAWPPQPWWNEWDFLDYADAGLAAASWNSTLQELPPGETFDTLVCVSVIEHLPASDRRALLAEMASRTHPGGRVVLTVDVERDSDALWNRERGRQVEGVSEHGTVQDIERELVEAGLTPLKHEVIRGWGGTPVDIGLYVAERVGEPR